MPTRRRSSRPSPLANLGIAVAILVGVGLMGYATANYFGLFEPSASAKQVKSREGLIPVPRSLANLKAFEKVEREDIYDREIGDDSYFWLPKAQVEANPDWFTRVDDVVGRVLARDKRADFVFSEKDFLPKGSRTGLAAGVPEGKQGFFLQADQVPGLRLLKMGDQFDLLASLPEEAANAGPEFGLLVGGIKARGNRPIPLNGVRLLVQGGSVVALTKGQTMTTQGGLALESPDSRGRTNRGGENEQLTIAIDPEEVVPLTQALGSKLVVHAVARTGRQGIQETPPRDELEGLVPFPAAALPLKAYSRIKATDLAEPLTGELRQYYFRPDAVRANWIDSVDDLLGRVVRRDIDPGYIFSEADFLSPDSVMRDVKAYERVEADDLTDPSAGDFIGRVFANDLSAGQPIRESDLLPPNASPGIAGGIPSDRMALTVSAEKVAGIASLSRGDHFDILASAPFDVQSELGGQVRFAGGSSAALSNKAVNTVLASEAVIVQRTDNSVTLAIHAEEVGGLTKALALNTPVFTIARSGRDLRPTGERATEPDAAATLTPLVSDADPMADIAVTEMIIGGKRTVSAYRRPISE